MPETAPVLKPKWVLLLEILKSPVIIAIVTALVSFAGGMVANDKMSGPKAPEAKPIAADELTHRLVLIEGHAALCVDAIQALRSEFKTPKAGLPSTQSAAAKSPAVRVEGLPAAKAAPVKK